jgi:hypothetical protein
MRLDPVLNVCVLAAVLAAGGCTASYRNAYDGDVRFEHCYRLDEEHAVSVEDKRGCWQRYNRESTFGQPRDRIEYGRAREHALALGAAPPTARAAGAGAPPTPTSAFAPPPQTLARDAGAAGQASSGRSGALAAAPGAYCGAGCGKDWIDCGQSCIGATCQSGCDERYRTCMRRCF